MEEIYSLIQQRNSIETLPFLPLHSANAYLQNLADTLQYRCESLERQYLEQQQFLVESQAQLIQLNANSDGGGGGGGGNSGSSKNESRLREKVAKLQDELNEKLTLEVKSTADALKASTELSSLRQEVSSKDATISSIQMELNRCNEIVTYLTSELEESKSRTRLAENQFDGLKDAIRSLQDENIEKTQLNERLLESTVSEKEKYVEQFNNMNDMVEKLQKEVAMLRSLTKMNKPWFGLPRRGQNAVAESDRKDTSGVDMASKRQWGAVGAVLPSQPQFTIKAHKNDASCVR